MKKFDIYEPKDLKEQEKFRYALGRSGKNMIICIGLNPSKASAEESDPTFTRIQNFLKAKGYENFVLLNLCPQRATKPKEVKPDDKLAKKKNAQIVEYYLDKYPDAEIWCAWGSNIKQEKFKTYFREIAELLKNRKCICTLKTKFGHPRHPLSVSYKTDFKCFCIKDYIKMVLK